MNNSPFEEAFQRLVAEIHKKCKYDQEQPCPTCDWDCDHCDTAPENRAELDAEDDALDDIWIGEEFPRHCPFDPQFIYDCDGDCVRCDRVPAPEDKKYGKAAPRNVVWRKGAMYGDPFPVCPCCGEAAFVKERCFYCGQKIIVDERLQKFLKPPVALTVDCPLCHAEDAVEYIIAYNGQRSGCCSNCGMKFAE